MNKRIHDLRIRSNQILKEIEITDRLIKVSGDRIDELVDELERFRRIKIILKNGLSRVNLEIESVNSGA